MSQKPYGAGNPIRLYGFQPDSIWTTDPIYQKTGQGYAYYQNDHLGMPQQLIQKNGAKVWGGDYRAFGELTTESGTWENRLRFPGQYNDQESGNFYNYFRDYDPVMGRYLQSDPIGLDGGINTYAYVLNNPLFWIDPDGYAPRGGLVQYPVDIGGGASAAGNRTPVGSSRSPMDVRSPQNKPTNIGGRDYSGHAVDRMQGRGIPPSVV
ncbi:MAG: RHS repeat-associated core domain-containing protein [Candidatus Thiodiazotropha endolucinida]